MEYSILFYYTFLMIKIIFFDLDGTVLSHKTNSVPESTVRAFDLLHDKGISLFTCTGRNLKEIDDLKPLHVLHFDGHALFTGHYCFDKDSVIFDCPMDKSDIQKILDYSKEHQIPIVSCTNEDMYMNMHNDTVRIAQKAVNSPLPPLGDINRSLAERVYQITAYLNEEQAEDILSHLHHTLMTRWNPFGIDLTNKDGSKGIAIQNILDHYHLTKEESMCFGDGMNDIDMMHACGISVCLGNGDEEVKKHASYVTDDIDRDGLMKALIHYHILN